MSARRRLPSLACGGVLAALLLAAPTSVLALSDNEARTAILELRQQLRDMSERDTRARLQLAEQIERLQTEVVRLRAEVEQATRAQQQTAQRGGSDGGDDTPKVSDPQEQAAYDGAIDQYRNGQYKQASESLGAFLTLYGDSLLAPTAWFYLGSSLYAVKDYKGAVTALLQLVEQHPDSARAPDALLVIAGSQFELNNRAGAKTTLQRIVKNYAGSPAAETAAKRLALL